MDRSDLTPFQRAWVERMRLMEYTAKRVRLDRQLTGNQRSVMYALLGHMDENGYCFPGYDLLMAEAGVARATLAACVKALVAQSWIGYGQTNGKNGRDKNHYWLVQEDDPKFNG